LIVKPVVFHPEAQAELFATQDYYERCVDGLGLDFRGEPTARSAFCIGIPTLNPQLSALNLPD